MCVFCDLFEDGKETIWEDEEWVVVPGLGGFTPGYCLLLPRECVGAYAHLTPTQLERAGHVLEAVRQAIAMTFRKSVAVAEHGIGRELGDSGSCCCVDHAHLHFFPHHASEEAVLNKYRPVGGEPAVLGGVTGLVNYHQAYLYLSTKPNDHLAWPWWYGFTKQFARRVFAGLSGERHWDWRRDRFQENFQVTLEVLRKILRPWQS